MRSKWRPGRENNLYLSYKRMKCKLCDRETTEILNIDFKETPVCRECCNVITMQNLKSLIYLDNQRNKDR